MCTVFKTFKHLFRILHSRFASPHSEEPRVRNFHSARCRASRVSDNHRLHIRRLLCRRGRHLHLRMRGSRDQQREVESVPELQEHAEDLRGEERAGRERGMRVGRM